jgi:hypothetical protein
MRFEGEIRVYIYWMVKFGQIFSILLSVKVLQMRNMKYLG